MTVQKPANWNYPTAIRFGPGRISELADAARGLGMVHPLLVTDPTIAQLPILTAAMEAIRIGGLDVGVFTEVQANPVGSNVDAGVAQFRLGGHDGVIAMGGGSALDAGKAIALMVGQNRALWDFEDVGDNWKRVDIAGVVPVVAVPTTSGTGSEVGRASVITDSTDQTKKIIFHPSMLPGLVIADPELTFGLPPKITAAVGMDALSHNLEAYCAPGNHPQADGIALEGIRLIANHLVTAVAAPHDLEARSGMMIASLMGATAFQKGLGAMHSMAHVLGARIGTHHGLANAIVMPYVLHANRSAVAESITRLARHIGLPQHSFEGFLDWVLALRADLGIPHTLAEVGLRGDHVEPFAQAAQMDPSTGTNPIEFGIDDFKALFTHALNGTLT